MARKPFVQNPHSMYHVTARCINREWFVCLDEAWEILTNQLYFTKHAFDLEILSFVMMSNHFHLLVRAPKTNLSDSMCWFMSQTSRTFTKSSHRINETWAGRYHRSEIDNLHYYYNAYKYVYHNPVKAKLTHSVVEYKYSTLSGKLGVNKLIIPVSYDSTLFESVENTLAWLDSKPNDKDWDAITHGLRRSVFRLPNPHKRKHRLEDTLL